MQKSMQCSPNLYHLKVLPGSWNLHGRVLFLSSWDWLWYLPQLLSFRTGKMVNYTEFYKQINQVIFLVLGPVESSLGNSLHWALALGWICSRRAEDSQSWGWSLQTPWLGLVRAQAGVLEVLSDDEGGGNELLLGYFLQVYFTHYVPQIGKIWCQGKDTQPVVTIHSLAALHGGVPSTPHSLPSFRKSGSKGEGNEMEKGKRGLTYWCGAVPWGESCGQH